MRLWHHPDLHTLGKSMFILHNNWMVGLQPKIDRQIAVDLWYWRQEYSICAYEADRV